MRVEGNAGGTAKLPNPSQSSVQMSARFYVNNHDFAEQSENEWVALVLDVPSVAMSIIILPIQHIGGSYSRASHSQDPSLESISRRLRSLTSRLLVCSHRHLYKLSKHRIEACFANH